ncbi:RES domain-containing protein [Microbacterium panaciterrae]|uniref:RES domain-containing protein n=1 Tax=Microbacterium panaciterrae TaxID=985759 RepID=A0ABP8PQX6_9MICO
MIDAHTIRVSYTWVVTQDLPELELTGDPGEVWHVGFEPDPWGWAPWHYANDSGLFDGRWDDQLGEFRTLYTADSLLGCFLELLARFRPSERVQAALDEIVDDDGSVGQYPEAPQGGVGYRWLEDRLYGRARQAGRYCAITHSRTLGALSKSYPLGRHGLTPRDVDAALLKDARDRDFTRSVARWLHDLHDGGSPLVDGVQFASRHGDELRMWAVFERADSSYRSSHLEPLSEPVRVTPDTPELLEAFERFGLHWHEA